MTLPSGLGMPDDDEAWLVREVRRLAQRVEEVANSVGQDGVTIAGESALRVKGSGTGSDVDVFFAGTFPDAPGTNDPATGERQRGLVIRRSDGSTALALGEFAADNGTPFAQALAARDAAGGVIFAEDSDSGRGLARPYLGGGLMLTDTNLDRWPQTTGIDETGAPTWILIADGQYCAENPRVAWTFQTYVPSGVTAQLRLSIGDLAVTKNVEAGTFAYWQDVVPLLNFIPGQTQYVRLEGRITAGAGETVKVCARPLLWIGSGS